MKAKDYFAKYEQTFMSSSDANGYCTAISEMLNEMNSEVHNLLKVYHVKTNFGVFCILKKMNRKWNAVARLFEKKYGAPIIDKDFFKLYWVHEMPQLMDKI